MPTLKEAVSHVGRWMPSLFTARLLMFACLGSLLLGRYAIADDGPDQPRDRRRAEDNNWIYNEHAKGFAEAKQTGKPLFVVIRCPP